MRSIFCGVLERAPKPNMQRQPSQKTDDMGARLKEPFSFSVDTSTTGVPKYKMAGVMVTWPAGQAAGEAGGGWAFTEPTIERGRFGPGRTVRRR